MTKDAYFEMCEALGTEPLESEIPIEYSDLLLDVQEALGIYSKLKDEWDTMNGHYLGKSYAGISDIFDILEVAKEDRRTMFDLIGTIDIYRSKSIKAQQPVKK
jgi:hypothetical protein